MASLVPAIQPFGATNDSLCADWMDGPSPSMV
jgi:hypothetical protein